MQEHVVTIRPQPGPYPTDAMLEELGRAALAAVRGEAVTLRIERGVAPQTAIEHVAALRHSLRRFHQLELQAKAQQQPAPAAPSPAAMPSTAHVASMPPLVTAQDLRNHLAVCTEPTCVFRAMAAHLGVK